MKIVRCIAYGIVIMLCLLTTGCFTGVESTPKITQKEIKKQNVVDTPERHVMDGIRVSLPSELKPGKQYYIADSRAARAAWRVTPIGMIDSLQGTIAVISAIDTIPSLTDSAEVRLIIEVPSKNATLEYHTGFTPIQWAKASSYTLPHMIEMDMVDAAQQRLKGNKYFILPSRRSDLKGTDTLGTRYQQIEVVAVEPATESMPLCVIFSDDEGHIAATMLSLGNNPTSRRNFETVFALENPRSKYKNISDENWQRIRHSQIVEGMTPDECRLALGPPDQYQRIPTTSGMVERWSYTNGIYLVFEDGVLSSFRR